MVFGGELTSFILCEGCRQLSSTDETFMDLSLSLKPDEKARKVGYYLFYYYFAVYTRKPDGMAYPL